MASARRHRKAASDGSTAGWTPSTRNGRSRSAAPLLARRGPSGRAHGFTLLEVLVAVAILSITMTSLLGSQMNALRATRYAQGVTVAAFMAEQKLIDIEFELKRDGWGDNDKEFEGDFAEEGWPDMTYACVVDMIELPEYTALQQAVDSQEEVAGGADGVQDAGEQAFDTLGMVWPIVKEAVEQSIRKTTCTVYWRDGEIEHDFEVSTYWTDPAKLTQLPSMGGEDADGAGEQGEEPPGGGLPGTGGEPGTGGGPGGRMPGPGGPGGGGPGGGGPGGGLGGGGLGGGGRSGGL